MKKLNDIELLDRITLNRFEYRYEDLPGYSKVLNEVSIHPIYLYRYYIPIWTAALMNAGYEPTTPEQADGMTFTYEDCVRADASSYLHDFIRGAEHNTKRILDAALAGGVTELLDAFFDDYVHGDPSDWEPNAGRQQKHIAELLEDYNSSATAKLATDGWL